MSILFPRALRSAVAQASLLHRRLPSSPAAAAVSSRAFSNSSRSPTSASPFRLASVAEAIRRPPSQVSPSLPYSDPVRPSRRVRRKALKAQRKASKKKAKKVEAWAEGLEASASKLSPFVRLSNQFKTFKPITPSIRWVRTPINDHLWKGKPERSLTIAKRKSGGRNNTGRITARRIGGGHKQRIRLVDFYRWQNGEQDVLRIEYDPLRSAHIALVQHRESGQKSYILAPDGVRAGDVVQSYRPPKTARFTKSAATVGTSEGPPVSSSSMPLLPGASGGGAAETATLGGSTSSEPAVPKSTGPSLLDIGIFRTTALRPGNVLPLRLIPVGTTIHALSLLPNGPAKLLRSAGAFGQVVSTTSGPKGQHAQVKLQSGEVRLVPINCVATIGVVSNVDHQHKMLGKAGRSRWLGRRPVVRGVAKNAVDHPHGGGRGKSKGNKHPRSEYGVLKFARTRKPGTRGGNMMVVKERPRRNGARKH